MTRASSSDARFDKLPPRWLPILYFGTAHVSLALAFACAGLWPRAVTGFFYHSWMVALVHLVTLGWITLSIAGAFYIVAPAALRASMPARRSDYAAYALLLIGLIGMVAHFWIEEFGGMAWSAGTAMCGLLLFMARVFGVLRRSAAPRAVTLHIKFAAINLIGAASAGVLLASDKVYHFLPGFVLSNVFAHAHLAAVGWATMMAVGVAYRLLPMVLPSAPPAGRGSTTGAIVMESGVVLLFLGLITRSMLAQVGGALVLAGLTGFLVHAGRMIATRRSSVGPARSDVIALHVVASGAWLIAAMLLGAVLLVAPMSEWTLHAALAYGVFGLLGFLAQLIVGMETYLLPLHVWYWQLAGSDFQQPPAPPLAMGDRNIRMAVFLFWLFGVPTLAAGFYFEAPLMVAVAAWTLLAGVLLAAVDGAFVVAGAGKMLAPERIGGANALNGARPA